MRYTYKFSIYLAGFVLLSFVLAWLLHLPLNTTILSIIAIVATFVVAYLGYHDRLLAKKLSQAGVQFCPDDETYLRAAADLIAAAKEVVFSLLSTWHIDPEIINALEKCCAHQIIFMGPIQLGATFPNAIARIRKTIEINIVRDSQGKQKIGVYHRGSQGIKFVVADKHVLLNSRPLRATANRATAGFVIKDSAEHADFFGTAFRAMRNGKGNLSATDRIEQLILEVLSNDEPVNISKLGNSLRVEGELDKEGTQRYEDDLRWFVQRLVDQRRIRETLEGKYAINSLIHVSKPNLIEAPQPSNAKVVCPIPYLSIAITSACNFSCIYCPPDGECYKTSSQQINKKNMLQLLTMAKEIGMSKVRITGGEPFLYDGLRKIVAHATTLGLEVHINTNGSLLEKHISWLKEMRDQVHLKVSLDCLSEKTLKEISSKNGEILDKLVSAVERSADAGLLKRLNFVLTSKNVYELPKVVEMARRLRVGLKVFDMFFVPETKAAWQELYLPPSVLGLKRASTSSDVYSQFYGIPIQQHEVLGVPVRIKDSLNGTHYHPDFCAPCSAFPCQEGLYCLVVTPSLTVVPCRLGIQRYRKCESVEQIRSAVLEICEVYQSATLASEFRKDYSALVDQKVLAWGSKLRKLFST